MNESFMEEEWSSIDPEEVGSSGIAEEDLPNTLEWTYIERNNIWKSEDYETTIQIPFTRTTTEFGFLNGDSKVIQYDEISGNPAKSEVGGITRSEYYQIASADSTIENRPGRLRLKPDDTPELVVVPANQTYEQVHEKEENVAVVDVSVRESVEAGGARAIWTTVGRSTIAAIRPRTETEGPYPQYPTKGVFCVPDSHPLRQ